jgi:lipoyl(octanoyl) transferase
VNSPLPSSWYLLRSGAGNPAHNMALDAALLEAAPVLNHPVLRFYSWTEPAATFGYSQRYADVAQMTLLRPLVRRPTGGGLVPHDADWTYSLVFPPGHAWHALKAVESYHRVHEWIQAAFRNLSIATDLASGCRKALPGQCFVGHEKSDVLWHGKKIAGAAQRRTRDGLLIQGSLQPPPIKIPRSDWEQAMCDTATARDRVSWDEFVPGAALTQRTVELSRTTFSQPAYNQRR